MYNLELDKVKVYDLEVNRASIAINKAKWGEISGEISNQTDLQKELDNKANKADVYTKSEIVSGFATKAELETKANKADIPSKVSQLTNDAGYINDVSDKADKSDIADMLTKTDAASTYATKETVANMDAKVNVAIENANTAADRVDTAIETANTAAANADTAASNANAKADLANTAASNANAKANQASNAVSAAIEQTNRLANLANNPPKIENDYWYIYDEDSDTYVKATKAKGESGVYVGSGDMPEGYNIQIDLDGDVIDEDSLVTKDFLTNYVYTKTEINAMIAEIYAAITK